MNKNLYTVIMADGFGSRFWPMSTKKFPKQFQDILGDGASVIQNTYNRVANLVPSENILVSTNNSYKDLVLEQLPKLSENDLILEPCKRSTAPSILYAALKIYQKNPDAIMLIAPSDHWIKHESKFINSVSKAFDYCKSNDVLMTLGIRPITPTAEYGYIKYKNESNEIKQVLEFVEKPNIEKAEEYLEQGDYLWNAGIFIWSAKSIIKAFKKELPEMTKLFEQGNTVYNTENEKSFIENNYHHAENLSIDFGVLESANNICVLPVDFEWNDLGTWNSLYSKIPKDDQNNAIIGGETLLNNAKNNIIRTQSHKKVVIQGLSDFIVVEKDNVLFICPKDEEKYINKIRKKVTDKFGDNLV